MKNIAIFASGNGTNAENIGRYFANSDKVKVAVVLSNNRHVGVHARVHLLHIPSFVFSREEFVEGTPIIAKLKEYRIDLIVLAGFMNKISNVLLEAYPHRIINIHPALLPKHGGKGMYGMNVHRAVIEAKEKESGATIHFVDNGIDTGEIIMNVKVPVLEDDTPETLQKRILEKEHILMIEGIKKLLVK